MSCFSTLVRWLQRKRYQYEVTFSLYMLTPTEKIIFNTLAVAFISMILIAAFFYLPGHVTEMLRRAWFYYAGDEAVIAGSGGGGGAAVGQGAGAVGGGRQETWAPGRRMDGQDVLAKLGTL